MDLGKVAGDNRLVNRLVLLVAVAFTASVFHSRAAAQTPPLWGSLRPGPHAVGYREEITPDPSRTFFPERDYEGKPYPGDRSRPVLIQLFYPAPVGSNAPRMLYGDYLNIEGDTPASAAVAEGLRRRTRGIHDYYQNKYLQPYKGGLFERLTKMETAAVRDAPAAGGRFPVVIYGGGTEFGTDENVVLCEFLASHGYVVAAVPMMGAHGVTSSADAPGLETQARDMEFLFARLRDFPAADLSRLGAMGFSYSGQAALLMAMRNPDVKAVVGLDPSFVSNNYGRFLKVSPFYNVEAVNAPVLEIHRKDEAAVTYDITGALRYSERYSFEVQDLNHVDFLNYAPVYTAVLPEDVKRGSPIAARKAAYEAMAVYVLDFLEVFLRGKAVGDALRKPAAWEGYPREKVSFRYTPALPAPPTRADLLGIARGRGVARAEQVYREVLARDPSAGVVGERSVNDLGYALLGDGKAADAVRVMRWNVERFPRSANAYDGLADAYRAAGDRPCAAYAYRRLLELLPQDASLDESAKASLRNNAGEQLQKLGAAGVTGKCESDK